VETLTEITLEKILEERKQEIIYHEGNERWCAIKGTQSWKPSVTTFIGAVLNKGVGYDTWLGNSPSYKEACKERDIAANRGTTVHNLCEKLIVDGKVTIPEETLDKFGDAVSKRLMSFDFWYQQHMPRIVTTEYKLYHPDVDWSGTPDIVGYINDKLCIIDIKTGAPYPSHQLQLTAYKILWDTIFPEFPIEACYGLYLKDSWISKVEPIFKKFPPIEEELKAVFLTWKWLNGGKPWPKSKYPVKTSFTILKEENENL
jgi:hypothetical protein